MGDTFWLILLLLFTGLVALYSIRKIRRKEKYWVVWIFVLLYVAYYFLQSIIWLIY
jgi:predicted membrane-bound dolichyl-phosphate-mannose-protein mannosyltransferase